jgi:N utilization substance protein B
MGVRRKAREIALQVLYGLEYEHASVSSVPEHYWTLSETATEVRVYAQKLVEGVLANGEKIDDTIREASLNWKLERMAVVDRNVLRIAVYELIFLEDVPERVSLNEAIEIVKRYGAEESGAFINGILDRIHRGVSNT